MNSSTVIVIITALSTLIGAVSPIIVFWLQSNKERQQSNNRILLPPNVDLHRPSKQTRWITILFYAFIGGVIGYGAATIANINPLDTISPTPFDTSTVSDTPQLTYTPDIPSMLSSASEVPFTDTPFLAPTESRLSLPTNAPIQSPTNTTVPLTPKATPLPPVITIPKDSEHVTRAIDVFGAGAQPALEPGIYLNIIVIVLSDGPPTYHVQAIPEIQADGTWRSGPVFIGAEGPVDIDKTFRICAVLHSQQLPTGEIPSFPTGPKSCINVIRK